MEKLSKADKNKQNMKEKAELKAYAEMFHPGYACILIFIDMKLMI